MKQKNREHYIKVGKILLLIGIVLSILGYFLNNSYTLIIGVSSLIMSFLFLTHTQGQIDRINKEQFNKKSRKNNTDYKNKEEKGIGGTKILFYIVLAVIGGILWGVYEFVYGEYEADKLLWLGAIIFILYIISKRNNENTERLQKEINKLKKSKKK